MRKYHHPSRAIVTQIKQETAQWLARHALRWGIPGSLELTGPSFHPHEMTFISLEELYERDPSPDRQAIQAALREAEANQMFEYDGPFTNELHGRPQVVYFLFDAHGHLLYVKNYEHNGVDHVWYDPEGHEHDPYAH